MAPAVTGMIVRTRPVKTTASAGDVRHSTGREPAEGSAREVTAQIEFLGNDEALVRAVGARQPAAVVAFYDRYSDDVLRLVIRVLGRDQEIEDTHHEAFVRALSSIGSLRDASCLDRWMASVAVLTARTCLQRRWRRRWLRFVEPEVLAEMDVPARDHDAEALRALRATYQILDQLPPDDRIAFVLRFIEHMDLAGVADACGVSLATVKRRLVRAEARFRELAAAHADLSDYTHGGSP